MPGSIFTTIFSNERLVLSKPLVTDHLIVHMGIPGPTIEAGDHALEYNTAEYIGQGEFTITRHGREACKVVQP